jgi:AraC-like DNA-binding protein
MSSSTIVGTRQAPTTTTRGLLNRPDRRRFELRRFPPAADLAWCVERHWTVEWDLPAGELAESELLPHPCVNVVLDRGQLMICGVGREVFRYPLQGRGRVYGVKLRPAAFRPFLGYDVARLTDRTVPATELWPEADPLAGRLRGTAEPGELVEATEDFLRGLRVEPDPVVGLLARAVFSLLTDPAVRQVGQVCALVGIHQRSLQRLFRGYVGVTPSWVLKRGRLHAAAERVAEQAAVGVPVVWAELAAELGYTDQAHFIHDFRRAVGESPARYAQRLAHS